jgi:hypothetical protein
VKKLSQSKISSGLQASELDRGQGKRTWLASLMCKKEKSPQYALGPSPVIFRNRFADFDVLGEKSFGIKVFLCKLLSD